METDTYGVARRKGGEGEEEREGRGRRERGRDGVNEKDTARGSCEPWT